MSPRPLVIFSKNESRGKLLREIIGTVYPHSIHRFTRFSECRQFIEEERVWLIYFELEPDKDEYLRWIRDLEDDLIGMISWQWEKQSLQPYVDAGIFDYIFIPPQPGQILDQVNHLLEADDTIG